MATRQLLAELAEAYRWESGIAVAFESVGGVDAAKRVHEGEPFDLVVLAADAIDKLVAAGRVRADGLAELARSGVAIAVREGAPHPDVGTEGALRETVRRARTIGFSTGPSGVALHRIFERWGVAEQLRDRLVQAPPGVPVGTLVARGEAELGFQQLSELMHLRGIDVIGSMPPGVEIVTTFSAGICVTSAHLEAARALLQFLQSPATGDAKRRQGMEPA